MDVGPVLWLRQPQSPRAIGASKGCGVRPAAPLLRSKVKKHQQTPTDSFKRLFDAPLESESFIWSTVLSELEEYRIWFAVLGCFRLFYNPQSLPSMETHALVLTQLYYADYAYITRRFRLVWHCLLEDAPVHGEAKRGRDWSGEVWWNGTIPDGLCTDYARSQVEILIIGCGCDVHTWWVSSLAGSFIFVLGLGRIRFQGILDADLVLPIIGALSCTATIATIVTKPLVILRYFECWQGFVTGCSAFRVHGPKISWHKRRLCQRNHSGIAFHWFQKSLRSEPNECYCEAVQAAKLPVFVTISMKSGTYDMSRCGTAALALNVLTALEMLNLSNLIHVFCLISNLFW